MTKGLFTGKSLANYFNQTTEDWVNARKIINGLDKAQAIAMYGHNFYSAISYTT
jgi:putative chitinase